MVIRFKMMAMIFVLFLTLSACGGDDGGGGGGSKIDGRFVSEWGEGVFCVFDRPFDEEGSNLIACDGPIILTTESNGKISGDLTLNIVGEFHYPFEGSFTTDLLSGWPFIADGQIDPPGSDPPHPLRLKGGIAPDDPNILLGIWLEGEDEVNKDLDASATIWKVERIIE